MMFICDDEESGNVLCAYSRFVYLGDSSIILWVM